MRYLYVVFKSSKNETWPHDFTFMFIWLFYWGDIIEKVFPKQGVWEKFENGDGHKGWLSIEEEFKPCAHYDMC